MNVSFAWTTATFLAGRKTCTRRMWKDSTFQRWCRAWDQGRHVHWAWDRQPRFGGRRLGRIRLTCRPYRERLGDMPEADLEAEGGLWASKAEFVALFGGEDLEPVVLRFRLLCPVDGKCFAMPGSDLSRFHGGVIRRGISLTNDRQGD